MSERLFTAPYRVKGVSYGSGDNNNNSSSSMNGGMTGEPPQVATVGGKGLDANQYATKKTVAQGMLDIALLTANASQLKYVLTVGSKHQFYTVMLTLIILSLVLQGLTALLLGPLTLLNLNKGTQQKPANRVNNVVMLLNLLILAVDTIKMGLDNGMMPMKNSTTLIP